MLLSHHCINHTINGFPAAHGAYSAFSVKPRISLIKIKPTLIDGGNPSNADRNASTAAGNNIRHARIITLEGQGMILDKSRPDKLRVGTSVCHDGEFARKSAVLKRQKARLSEHLKATGLLPDNSRVRVDGFGKSVSQKAVHAAKRCTAGKTNINSGSNNSRPYYPANADFLNSTAFKKQLEGLFNPKLDKAVCKYSQLAVVENDNKPSETIYLLSESGITPSD